jgi:DNA-binding transcriptional LysR family regulator
MNESNWLNPEHLRQLASFAAAARLLNFSAAAREVGCTASVLSRRIAALERASGGRLFLRTTRRMALTALGENLAVQCERLEDVLGDVARSLRPAADAGRGSLRLHLPAAYGRHRLAPLLAEFARRHPQLKLEATYDDAYADLVTARVDLAVRVGRLDDAQLVARRLGEMHRWLCAAPAYLAGAPPLREPRDLLAHRCIVFDGMRPAGLWQLRRGRQRRSVRVQPAMLTNDLLAAHHAALAGAGITMLGDYMAQADLDAGRLVRVLPGWEIGSAPVQLLWLPGADRAPRVRGLIDFLVAELAGP